MNKVSTVHSKSSVSYGAGPPANESGDFDDFVYVISHDLRNSIRALIEVPQWIAEDLEAAGHSVEGTLGENLDLLNAHARRLDQMLHDLLVYSRIGRGQEICKNDLAAAIATVCSEQKIPPDVRMDVVLKTPTIVMRDGDLLTLLGALLSNALRHRDADMRHITIGSRAEGGGTVLSFRDDGPGVRPEFREKIFQVMTTLKSRDEVEGSGMGLAHVQKILKVHGGRLAWVDQPDGRGVGFELWFSDTGCEEAPRI
ncbi:sensor histidine kinase [Pararhodobacter zhoushanensis]|uniref:sensor histidine kinase n=1 Tax=Pararhodobacter zhoushanensis TaxID=2479545 RepID=UPI0013E08101|nr:HAMP domain-containing sensor histidine kinase [Pararhodobacter zhoushanensis]